MADMKKIGIIYGMENTFPPALVDRINARDVEGVVAEHIRIGGIRMADPSGYRVIIDRISQDVPFYRAYLKNAVLGGTIVINNPFWWSADDKFFNYALASKIGVAIPRTVILPHKELPPGTTSRSMRNLIYPLDWDGIFDYVGFPAFLKPYSGGGWKSVYKVDNPDDFFRAYDDTGDLCMTLQHGVEFKEYFRCYVVGQEKVHIMQYDPRRPHAERYVRDPQPVSPALLDRVEKVAR
jgi:glutathione synthase/RimK-type ligase-like ATP-grasp enzyme